jgi:hypothetical protein
MPEAQGIDRERGARLGGEKGGDGFRRGRGRGPAVDRAPAAETSDGGAVRAARVFGTRRTAVLRRGVGGVIKVGERRGQFDDRLEVEPVRHVLGCSAGRQRNFFRA